MKNKQSLLDVSRSILREDVPLRCDDTLLWHDDDADGTDYSDDDVDDTVLMIPKLNRNDSTASDA